MFERFTEAAKGLVLEAQAQRRATAGHQVRTEHLLLALLADPGPVGDVLRQQGIEAGQIVTRSDQVDSGIDPGTTEDDDQLLLELGIDVDAIRVSIDEKLGPGALDRVRADRTTTAGQRRGFDPASKQVIELSLREALRLKTKHIGPEHIGLGILRANQSAACQLLVAEDIDVVALRIAWETIALQAQNPRPQRSLLQRLRS